MIRHWIHDMFDELMSHDNSLGTHLYADIRRITSCVEELEAYLFRSSRLSRIADEISDVADIGEFNRAIWNAGVTAGFQHATVFLLKQGTAAPFRVRVCTSFPEKWINRYKSKNYQFIDPIVAFALENDGPFLFSDAQGGGPLCDEFWKDAEGHGIGRNGLCVPALLPDGSKIGFSFVSSNPEAVVYKKARHYMSDLSVICETAAQSFDSLARVSQKKPAPLSDEELRFLHILLVSDNPKQALKVLPRFGSNKSLQDNIMRKLGVKNIIQATALASSNGWFSDLSYDFSDVSHVIENLKGWELIEDFDD